MFLLNGIYLGFLMLLSMVAYAEDISKKDTQLQQLHQLVESFAGHDKSRFLAALPKDGVLICRWFTSGTYGARGKETCEPYQAEFFGGESSLSVDVPEQTPIDLAWLFDAVMAEPQRLSISRTASLTFSALHLKNDVVSAVLALAKTLETQDENLFTVVAINDGYLLFQTMVIEEIVVGGVMHIATNENGLVVQRVLALL